MKFRIIHTENDGLNNRYVHSCPEFENLDKAIEYLKTEFLNYSEDQVIYEDGDEYSYTLGFNMFSEAELLEANPEIKTIDEIDDIPTEYWTIEEDGE